MRLLQPERVIALSLLMFIIGCAALPQQKSSSPREIQRLSQEITDLQNEVRETRQHLRAIDLTERTARADLVRQVEQIGTDVARLPRRIGRQCAPQTTTASECPPETKTVEISAGKAVLGELEEVWLSPPGLHMVARIDTGATSSSLNAEDVVEFERDGEDWVRFKVAGKESKAEFEAAVIRHAKVIQQADPKGSRRPVVSIRVQLGEIDETVEFTLADRSHLEHSLILGRNFLRDLAVVDVARKFIQPSHAPAP